VRRVLELVGLDNILWSSAARYSRRSPGWPRRALGPTARGATSRLSRTMPNSPERSRRRYLRPPRCKPTAGAPIRVECPSPWRALGYG
jgi:hypothetical protein